MELYPLLMSPSFRHGDETPWGGSMLRDLFGKDAPEGRVGACLEVSCLPGPESTIRNGALAGSTLTAAVERLGEALTGTAGCALTVSLLDAAEAAPSEDEGCARAWGILCAEADSVLTLNGEEKKARPGDVYYLPAGTQSVLGAGIQCYEVRACSAVPAPQRGPQLNEGTTVLYRGGSRTYYAADECLELSRVNLTGRMPLPSGRMLLLTAMSPCTLQWGEDSIELSLLDTAVIPAALEGATLSGDARLLMACASDREALRTELGYRAENVAGLVD